MSLGTCHSLLVTRHSLMKTLIILNPWAGRGTAGQRRGELEAALGRAGVAFELVTTYARGGATELTYQAIERGYGRVVAVGGDGTINEVVNGLLGARQRLERSAQLGIVPLGTGSDFVKTLAGLEPNDLDGAARRLAQGQTHLIDAARITVEAGSQELQRYFINGLGMGIDAQVAVESLKLTRLKGFAVYLVAIIRALASYRPSIMTVRYEGRELRKRMLMASVANGRCQGGGFWITPEALLDDGALDICLVEQMRLDEIIRHLPKLMEGSHMALRQVTMGRAQQIEVVSNAPMPVATDGEVVATDARRVLIEVLPAAVELVGSIS
jgi:diacylglycerol kinase (ATP)